MIDNIIVNDARYYSKIRGLIIVKQRYGKYADLLYNKTSWSNLIALTDEEIYELYLICRNSWK